MENHRNSNRKKKRSQGFRSRRQTKGGRKVINRQRSLKAGFKKRRTGHGIKKKTTKVK
jgi:ribosomal protein L34